MAHVDDLIESRSEKILLTLVARLAHRALPQSEIGDRANHSPEPKTPENQPLSPASLQKRILPHDRSDRTINGLAILPGRLSSFRAIERMPSIAEETPA